MTAPIIKLRTMYTITLPQTVVKQVHLLYIIADVFLIAKPCILAIFYICLFAMHCEMWYFANNITENQTALPINVVNIVIICGHTIGALEVKWMEFPLSKQQSCLQYLPYYLNYVQFWETVRPSGE